MSHLNGSGTMKLSWCLVALLFVQTGQKLHNTIKDCSITKSSHICVYIYFYFLVFLVLLYLHNVCVAWQINSGFIEAVNYSCSLNLYSNNRNSNTHSSEHYFKSQNNTIRLYYFQSQQSNYSSNNAPFNHLNQL